MMVACKHQRQGGFSDQNGQQCWKQPGGLELQGLAAKHETMALLGAARCGTNRIPLGLYNQNRSRADDHHAVVGGPMGDNPTSGFPKPVLRSRIL